MGKKRLKNIAPVESVLKKKSGKGQGRLTDMAALALEEAKKVEEKEKEETKLLAKVSKEQVSEEIKTKKARPKKIRSRRYLKLRTFIDRKKLFSPSDACTLLVKIANARIDETVQVHFSTLSDKLTGSVKLPHGTGKKQIVVIADEKVIDNISNGKIDFDILITTPQMMPKIAKVARVLGPKGLMPNPKSGTITNNPEALKKKLEEGEFRFKTEPKAPLLHLTIGKISFGAPKILANLEALIEAVKPQNIKKATLTSTHSPGIKLKIARDLHLKE